VDLVQVFTLVGLVALTTALLFMATFGAGKLTDAILGTKNIGVWVALAVAVMLFATVH
jgi:hypothetical protein